ncbi:MAG: EAL domain-containing protein [Candidatus Kaistia colombiensis]|nr:MAG: EAL domain-containing protein [Kaistia sp.]
MVTPLEQESWPGNRLSIVFVNPPSGAVTTIDGPPVNLSATSVLAGTPIRNGFGLISSQCVGRIFVCIVQVVGLREIWREYSLQIVLIVLAGAALGASCALLVILIRRKRATFESRLRRALSSDRISLEYQPIVDLSSGRISGAEALMRWTLHANDRVSPAEFVAGAEKSPLITDLTCFAIETAGRELRSLLVGKRDFVVSINIVSRDLTDPRFVGALEKHIGGAGICSSRIALELTERQPIDTPEAMATIKALHAKGYRIYIDDFGTGYSNLSYLGEMAIDAIKVDMIFTQSVGNNNIRARLIPSILAMAKDLGVTLVVEGVETAEQESYFKIAGAHFAQGWRYGRGVPADHLLAIVRSGQLQPAN